MKKPAGVSYAPGMEERMPILNYTTKVDIFTTLGEIQRILVAHGARKIVQDYDVRGRIIALSFLVKTPLGEQAVRLPANVDAVYAVLQQQKVRCGREQAERVAWRIIKDWLEAQMAILEAKMVQIDEIVLPYILDRTGCRTFLRLIGKMPGCLVVGRRQKSRRLFYYICLGASPFRP